MPLRIITDTTANLDPELLQRLGIISVPLSVQFPDQSFSENEIDPASFYRKMASSPQLPTSSQPPPALLEAAFRAQLEQGNEVLAVFISSGKSGTWQAAEAVSRQLREEFPQTRIEVIDSQTTAGALGLAVIAAAQAAQAGTGLEETAALVRELLPRIRLYFLPGSLEHLHKGGRIGGATALIGSLLKIQPVLCVSRGVVAVVDKVRGRKAALQRLLAVLDQDVAQYGISDLLVHHIDAPAAGAELAALLRHRYGREVPLVAVMPVVGLHVGPNSIGLVYVRNDGTGGDCKPAPIR